MCGIIGYTGPREAAPILMDGLSSLEYRGYDSAGIAVIGPGGETNVHKASGKLANLKTALCHGMPSGHVGIGHTRWATHGGPTDFNAHPHAGSQNDVTVVHNGIVENYLELREELTSRGFTFKSQTDSECIPNLIEMYLMEEFPLEEAVRKAALRLRGANAVVVVSSRAPDKIVAFRLGNAGGIVVGYGENEMLLASDLPALVPHTRKVLYLAGGEMVVLTPGSAVYSTLAGETLQKRPQLVQYDALSAAKGEYRHYMLKEINQQPEAVADTLGGRLNFEDAEIVLEDFPYSDEELLRIERVVLIGMGTSMHAAMVGRTWMEDLARIPTEVDNSSEFRYRNPVLNERTLVISISQSGETADTLAAMEEAMRQGAKQITLCNYAGTQTTRLADGTILIRSGPEIGVAATKTFVCSLVSLYLLSMYIARRRGTIARERLLELMQELMHLPGMMASYLADQSAYEPLAQKYSGCKDFLFLGRGINFPLAMEGALKLKEISYIHAEGYPAGEMKHGPISLIDGAMPVLAIIPKDELYEKMLSNINEVKARSGTVIAVATEGDEEIGKHVDQVIRIPRASRYVTPIIMALPLQLLAYHIAVLLGKDVDQPRNLAKSVTVE